MQKVYTLALLLIALNALYAQQHDNIWQLGYDSQPEDLRVGGSTLDFTADTVSVYYESRPLNMDLTNASFCDANGNLLLATNGIYIADAFGDPIENGEGLNPGPNADAWGWLGYRLRQGAMFLPSPLDSNIVYLFHLSKESPWFDFDHYSRCFYSSKIENINSEAIVTDKNTVIIEDSLNVGKITAVKHADGKNWWLILREVYNECYYRWLWDGEEIHLYPKICFADGETLSSAGQAVFSPDGSRFIYQNFYDDVEEGGTSIQIYDFDRCTGALSNRQSFGYIDGAWGGGVAISPNSRFLYVSSYYYLYQYDLWATDIAAAKDTIAEWDGWVDPEFSFLESTFNSLQLAPDDKIYMSCRGATNVLHRINRPNMQGDSCDFVQRAIQLPTYNARSIPNFPNYRLGASETICDTVTSSTTPIIHPVIAEEVKVYPNPAKDQLFVWLAAKHHQAVEWRLRDVSGHLLRQESLYLPQGGSSRAISVKGLPSGLYLWELQAASGEVLGVGKLVVTNFSW